MIGVNAAEVNDAVVLLSTVLPQAVAAYGILKAIWMRTNPGKSEADYVAYLGVVSKANVDESEAILMSDGYVKDGDGNWSKPER